MGIVQSTNVTKCLIYSRTPRVGFEPTTLRLTAGCSTAELSRIIKFESTLKIKTEFKHLT